MYNSTFKVMTDRCGKSKSAYYGQMANGKPFCVGGKMVHQYIQEYALKYFDKYADVKKFGKFHGKIEFGVIFF
jgi:hypothetical protein